MPVQAILTARFNQPVDDQQLQNFLPADCLTSFGQTVLPELIHPELPPQFASQPTVPKHARIPQLQFPQPNLNAIDGIVGNDSVLGKLTHRAGLMPILTKHRQSFSPPSV